MDLREGGRQSRRLGGVRVETGEQSGREGEE